MKVEKKKKRGGNDALYTPEMELRCEDGKLPQLSSADPAAAALLCAIQAKRKSR